MNTCHLESINSMPPLLKPMTADQMMEIRKQLPTEPDRMPPEGQTLDEV
jgi:hypothetical protein